MSATTTRHIPPDIDCPRCGTVIVCPHTMRHNHSSGVRAANLPGSFLQRVAALDGAQPRAQRPAAKIADIAQPGRNPGYVAAAVRADLDRLTAAHEGVRNHTLFAVACNVFEFVKAGHADESVARAELERRATAIGLPHSEIHATLRSAWQKVEPRSVPAPSSAIAASVIEVATL